MKKKNSDKTVLCYIGIVVCLLFIIVPPVLRKIVPKQEIIVVDTDYRQMNCSSSDNGELIVINYKGDDFQIGQIKYTFVMDAETFRANVLKTDMERSYNLSRREDADNNTMTYVLSPLVDGNDNVLDSSDLYILSVELKQNPDNQKEYYEKLGFSCSISSL